jgi:lysophospholipase L1-like esterase
MAAELPAARRKSGLLARVVLLLAAVLLCLALGEVALRAIGFGYRLYPEHIEFGWPNTDVRETKFVPHPRLLWVDRDYAARVERLVGDKPAVVFMGCSCTALGTYDDAFVRLFAMEHEGATLATANLAHSGWSSLQGLEQMQADVVRIAPAVVTIFYGWNDHWFGFGVEDKVVAELNSSLLYKLSDVRLVQLFTKVWVGASGGARADARPNRVSPEDFRANLRAMVDLARAHGIEPVLLTAPSSHERGKEPRHLAARWLRDLDELIPLHQRYVAIVRAVAEEKGVVLCDLEAEFARLPREDVEASFRKDGIHFLEPGSERVAKMLYECFRAHGLLERLVR